MPHADAGTPSWTDRSLLPVTVQSFTPFATKLSTAKPKWIWAWIGWDLQTGGLEALRRLGWKGNFLGWSHIQAEDDLPRVKDTNFYAIGTNAYFQDGAAAAKDIEEAAKAANIPYPANRLTEGWVGGLAIEATFRAAMKGGKVDRASIAEAMENLTIDTKGLRGAPITWTKDNHFRTVQAYRVHHWNGAKLEAVGDWRRYDVK